MFGVSKQAYHKQNGLGAARKAAQEAFALEFILETRKEDPGIGGMKLWHMYKREFPDIDRLGRDRLEDLVHRNGLKVRDKPRRPRTTDSAHGLPVYPNLAYSLIPAAVNQLWVSDITYIPIWPGGGERVFCYLSMVTDAYNHEIIGWRVGPSLEARHSLEALAMAMGRLEGMDKAEAAKLIHHSDRGVQYASKEYVAALRGRGIRISMTENGNPKENAVAERVNLTVKGEILKGRRFTSIAEVIEAVARAVEFYNTRRPHMSLDMMTPAEAAKRTGEIKKRWKSYRDEAIKGGRA